MTEKQKTVILLNFLRNPLSRRDFDTFFKVCYQQTMGYLRYLRCKGYRLPNDNRQSEKSLEDLSFDILGMFLQSRKDRPFFKIFDYYKSRGIISFQETNGEDLLNLFMILLTKNIRQELAAIRKLENPQLDHLKRRFKDILKPPVYGQFTSARGGAEFVYIEKNEKSLRIKARQVSYEDLIQIVEKAYLDSNTREEWCARIFRILDESNDLQNCLKKHELLRAVIAANSRYAEIYCDLPSRLISPAESAIRTASNEALHETMTWVRQNTIRKFLEKGRISPEEAEQFQSAVDNYLTDLGYDGDADPKPDYYFEIMPESFTRDNLRQHKYILDTIFKEAHDHFVESLKKNPTILDSGNYLKDGME